MAKPRAGADAPRGAGNGAARPRRREQIERAGEDRARERGDKFARLDALGAELAKKRREAVDARRSLGIDDQWRDDIEFYEGIDDANRGDSSSWHTKPPGQAMPDAMVQTSGEVRSTVFVNITRPYCDAAAARIGDMLMPTDDRSYAIDPTPIPELEDLAKGQVGTDLEGTIAHGVPAEQGQDLIDKAIAAAKRKVEEAKKKAKRAEKRIDDWFVENQYHAEMRRVIDDAAKIGSGILKGPVPTRRRAIKVEMDAQGAPSVAVREKIIPGSTRVDPMNFFPDGACGENIHNGSHTWERDFFSTKRLRELKRQPGYIEAQIDECLREGPQPISGEAPAPQGTEHYEIQGRFEVWYYYGAIEPDDLEAAGYELEGSEEELRTKDVVHAIVTMVNSRVVKATLNPLDTGEFPYDVMVWQRQAGKWTGIGVARQIRTPQRMVNAATRNMMDNAGLSAGPQIVVKLGAVVPMDGDYTLVPRKVWYLKANIDVADVKSVFGVFNIDSRQDEIMAIIEFGLRMAEDVTGLPLLMQGQQGTAPDTVGGMQILNNNSSTVLRRLAKNYDDGITEPHVRRYYAFLLQYSDDDTEKGDFTINARGSSALVERDLQNQAIMQMGNVVMNPAFGASPKKWFAEFCKSQHLDPRRFQYTEEEQQRIDELMSQQPDDPRVAVAQMRADLEQRLAQFGHQSKERLMQLEQHFDREQGDKDRVLEAWLKSLEQTGARTISIDEIKAKLAETSMQLRTQTRLSMASLANQRAIKSQEGPTEPKGRAKPGQAYQR